MLKSHIAMSANTSSEESKLLDDAVSWLGTRIPASWRVERQTRVLDALGSQEPQIDSAIEIRAANGTGTTFVVEVKHSLEPRDVKSLLPGLAQTIRAVARHIPVLVVAPWLSARTREMLVDADVNFVDMTGNAWVRLDNPALYIQSDGATRNPRPQPRGPAQVRGAKAARLVRLLADVQPPYGVGELATATGLAQGYVSRLLDALDRDALVERSGRGRVESVDVAGLLRRWVEAYDVLRANDVATFVAPSGVARTLELLRGEGGGRVIVTGSFAARRFAPVAASELLMAYCDDVAATAAGLGLLPADEGANVALLGPFDKVVWERVEKGDGLEFAAPSQVVADCLTGTGRMPAEGQALLEWMCENESRWRRAALADLVAKGRE